MHQGSSLQHTIDKATKLQAVQIYENKFKLFGYHFLIGVAHGLGAFFGASVLIGLVVVILSEFQWVPFIGEFIVKVIEYLKATGEVG